MIFSWHSAQLADPANVAPGIAGGTTTFRCTVAQETKAMMTSNPAAVAISVARCFLTQLRLALIRSIRPFMNCAGCPQQAAPTADPRTHTSSILLRLTMDVMNARVVVVVTQII